MGGRLLLLPLLCSRGGWSRRNRGTAMVVLVAAAPLLPLCFKGGWKRRRGGTEIKPQPVSLPHLLHIHCSRGRGGNGRDREICSRNHSRRMVAAPCLRGSKNNKVERACPFQWEEEMGHHQAIHLVVL